MQPKTYPNKAGAWHHFLVQELRKKQRGEDFHEPLVAAALRHLRRYGSNDAFQYYHDAYKGLKML